MYEYRNTAFESRTTAGTGIPFAAALYAALATAYSWPLAWHLGDRVPVDGYDSLLNAWLLWWNAHRVPFTSGWWHAPFSSP